MAGYISSGRVLWQNIREGLLERFTQIRLRANEAIDILGREEYNSEAILPLLNGISQLAQEVRHIEEAEKEGWSKAQRRLCQRQSHYLSSNVQNRFLPLVEGKGCRVWDVEGNCYLDFSSQTLNLVLGHSYPAIVEAVECQLSRLTFASSRFQSDTALKLAQRLVSVAPSNLVCVNHKMCNGSDAVEAAIKIARKASSYRTILVTKAAWHGESAETLRLCYKYSGSDKDYLGGSREVDFVEAPYCFRCPFKQNPERCHMECIAPLERAITDKQGEVAAFLIDPLHVNGGLYVHSDRTEEYLRLAKEICQDWDIPFIFDEVQTYGGWLDNRLFAADYFGVSPNLMCLAKGFGAGFPIAAVLMEERYRDVLAYNEAEYTNGGQPIACAAALAALNEILQQDFEVKRKAELVQQRLEEIAERYTVIGDIRRAGLIIGVEFCHNSEDKEPMPEICRRIYDECINRGVIFRIAMTGNTLLIKPPIIVREEEINQAMDVLEEALAGILGERKSYVFIECDLKYRGRYLFD